jgi:hypothetical protein
VGAAALEDLRDQGIEVVDAADGHDGVDPVVGPDEERLVFVVADHAQAQVAAVLA